MTPLILRHLSGEPIGRFPVWMMRQAGRYLPSYRAIRERHTFWEMVTNSDVAAEVSLLPVRELPVDGVIFFSDILTLPYGLGMGIEMKEAVGPVLPKPLGLVDFEKFQDFKAETHTPFVGEALRKIRQELSGEKALLGFAGAPWTVACYLIEGRASRHFESVKSLLYSDPHGLKKAMSQLGQATIEYLKHQHRNGVQVAQLFDTWIGEMPRDFFLEYYVPVLNEIFTALRRDGLPMIYFTKASHHVMSDFPRLDVDILSVDSQVSLREVDRRLEGRFSLQGNLDPVLLLKGEPGMIRNRTRALVQEARELKRPAILNLGHGILPKTPVENARAFLEEAIQAWL